MNISVLPASFWVDDYLGEANQRPERLLVGFSSAQLVRNEPGRLEVRGGTDADRVGARR